MRWKYWDVFHNVFTNPDVHAWNQYAYIKHLFWEVFPKRVLSKDFAFKTSAKYVEVRDKFWDWEILNKVNSIFDFKSVVPSLYKIRG